MRPRTIKVTAVKLDPYEVRDAVNTIARAHEHMANPKMMKAVRDHVQGLNKAVTGGLKPKRLSPRPGQKKRA